MADIYNYTPYAMKDYKSLFDVRKDDILIAYVVGLYCCNNCYY